MKITIHGLFISILLFSSFASASLCNTWEESGRLDSLTHGAKVAIKGNISANDYAKLVGESVKTDSEHNRHVMQNIVASLIEENFKYSAFTLCMIYDK
ncbi:hypothetical protein ACU5EH_02610 [Aliivibrio salmonicida]|uniref:hypothetical protein n=1 Tax=Aliivibrio salmonicida TaxID=40269 RepID=UPI00406C456C